MTSRGAPSQMEIRFSIDGRPKVLRTADITVALGLPMVLANSSAITERDGSLSRSRYHGRAYTLPPTTFPADAPRGPRTSDQPIPTSALCTAQGSYTRGSIQDIQGILVQSIRARHDLIATLRGEGPP